MKEKCASMIRITSDFNLVIPEAKMAMITTILAVGTAIGAVIFSVWLVKQLFTGAKHQ
jgi:hypothetical protein